MIASAKKASYLSREKVGHIMVAASISGLAYLPVIECDDHIVRDLLDLRNDPDVRKHFFSSQSISKAEHRKWIQSRRTPKSPPYYAVLHDGVLVGAVGISAVRAGSREAAWTFHIKPEMRRQRLATEMLSHFLKLIFDPATYDSLIGEVLPGNVASQALHVRLGFQQIPEGRTIVIDGKAVNAAVFRLTRHEWARNLRSNHLSEK